MRVSVGSDHRGVLAKSKIIAAVQDLGHEAVDRGTGGDASVDYPDFAAIVCKDVTSGESIRGILICGTGIGMTIAANKFPGIRAANCFDEVTAEISRRHNNANILCLPGDFLGDRPVAELVRVWLETEFAGGRHQRRLDQIEAIEAD